MLLRIEIAQTAEGSSRQKGLRLEGEREILVSNNLALRRGGSATIAKEPV